MNSKAFEIGKIYSMFSPCDQNCTWVYEVIARTAKTVTLKQDDGEKVTKCRISEDNNGEYVKPLGRYSMSPTLRA